MDSTALRSAAPCGFARGVAAWLAAILGFAGAPAALAGEADVEAVRHRCDKSGCRFDVTLRHADKGWGHYADAWEVLDENGKVLARRVLRHPHVDEQPFTRWLAGVKIPAGTKSVTIRGHDKVHGYGGEVFRVDLAEPPKQAPTGAGD